MTLSDNLPSTDNCAISHEIAAFAPYPILSDNIPSGNPRPTLPSRSPLADNHDYENSAFPRRDAPAVVADVVHPPLS